MYNITTKQYKMAIDAVRNYDKAMFVEFFNEIGKPISDEAATEELDFCYKLGLFDRGGEGYFTQSDVDHLVHYIDVRYYNAPSIDWHGSSSSGFIFD